MNQIESTTYEVELETTERMLGTIPHNQSVYATFIASKAADLELAEEEVATVQNLEAKGWTGFHKDEEGFFLYNYSLKGFMKEAARTLKTFGLVKQLQDKFTRYVFVTPRKIRLPWPKDKKLEVLERPIRCQTAMGPRVSVCRSDYMPEGTILNFNVTVLLEGGGITEDCLEKVLSYGEYCGLGQWRSGGFGQIKVNKA